MLPYLVLLFWVIGVGCLVRGAALMSPALAWSVAGVAVLAMMVWLLGQQRKVS